MPNEDHPRRTGRPEAVRVPDQLQQAKLPTAPHRNDGSERVGEGRRTAGKAGVLWQLETERGHD